MSVFSELKHRKVLQTAALYFAIAWGATEILSFLIERIPVFPAWTDTAIAILFVLGFPVAVFLAWMFDVGKDGVRRADPASGMGKSVIVLSVTGLLVATGALSYLLLPMIQAEKGFIHEGDLGTVAVLPFENLTGDPSMGYLGVGLGEDIRQRLSMFTDLEVVGRVSIAGFGGASTDISSVRNVLGAGLMLQGNLQNMAGQLRVSTSLVNTATGRQVWSNTFNAAESGWGPLRQRILESLGEQLALTVRVKESESPVPDGALDAYLRALSELSQPEVADSWFDEAIRLAPDFADAWARMALLRMDMIWYGMPQTDGWEEAEPLFRRAREIEPDNLLAEIAEAQLQWLARLDPFAAYDVLQRVEARAPNHPLVVGGIANSLRYIPGKLDDARKYSRRYLALDPLNPDAHNILATALMFQHKHEQGFQHYDRAEELDPNYILTYEFRSNQEFYRTSPADALATLTRRARVEGGASDATQRCMLFMVGVLLPVERAVPLLENAIAHGAGMSKFHAWCGSPLGVLVNRLETAGRDEDASAARVKLDQFMEDGGDLSDTQHVPFEDDSAASCEDELCRIRVELGEETMAAWLGPDPPVHGFSAQLAVEIVEALIDAGQDEDGRRLAALAGAVAHEFAGPRGHPTITNAAVMLMALSGDIEGALTYAEQVGPGGFTLFGTGLEEDAASLDIPEFSNHPRWSAFTERCDSRLQAEVEKFDRMVASGEIVMP